MLYSIVLASFACALVYLLRRIFIKLADVADELDTSCRQIACLNKFCNELSVELEKITRLLEIGIEESRDSGIYVRSKKKSKKAK